MDSADMVLGKPEKVRENKLRRLADRQGLRLSRSRTRDVNAMDHGLYALIDIETGGSVSEPLAGRWIHTWTLDEAERYLLPSGSFRFAGDDDDLDDGVSLVDIWMSGNDVPLAQLSVRPRKTATGYQPQPKAVDQLPDSNIQATIARGFRVARRHGLKELIRMAPAIAWNDEWGEKPAPAQQES